MEVKNLNRGWQKHMQIQAQIAQGTEYFVLKRNILLLIGILIGKAEEWSALRGEALGATWAAGFGTGRWNAWRPWTPLEGMQK